MIKCVELAKRHPSLTVEEFKVATEKWAEALAARIGPWAARFARRYYIPDFDGADVSDHPYDVLIEEWFADEASYHAAVAAAEGDAEVNALASVTFAARTIFQVQDVDRCADVREHPGTIKQVEMLKRLPGITVDEFHTRYDRYALGVVDRIGALCARYVQRYVAALPGSTEDVDEYPFDVVTELWWDNQDDFNSATKLEMDADDLELQQYYQHVYAQDRAFGAISEDHETDLSRHR